MTLNYDGLPEHMRAVMRDYIESRWAPGGFLTAVLSNDLAGACGHADWINRDRLFEIVEWLWNEAPRNCWGSPETVKAWLNPTAALVAPVPTP